VAVGVPGSLVGVVLNRVDVRGGIRVARTTRTCHLASVETADARVSGPRRGHPARVAGPDARPVTTLAWVAVAVFVAAYVLIATEKVHRVTAALGGAAVMLLIGASDAEHAFFSEESGVDWNVIFLLLGMMLIVAVLKRTGAFEYVAIWAAKRAKGRPFPVMVILVLVTAVASAALDNVTTVLLIAPVTFLVCDRLGVPVVPFLIAEALASNIGGTATLVGDPPNIIIASRAGLTYNDFLVHLAPFIVFVMVVFIGLCRWLFRSAFRSDPRRAATVAALRERDAIRDPRLLAVSLAVLGAVTIAFVLHTALHLEPAVVAMLGGLLLLALSRLDTTDVARDVEWPTLVFFAGLFIMVGALVNTGVIDTISRAAADAVEGRLLLASMALLWGSAVLSAIVDNIPYVATMSPVVADLVAADGTDQSQVLWWSLALGADLGGNATAVGASANVIILGIAEKAGRPISFWQFTKYGLVVTLVTVALAVPYLWLRYFILA
jgi:Na+/H+ antiporter NhaD/arsenite permease-like protein